MPGNQEGCAGEQKHELFDDLILDKTTLMHFDNEDNEDDAENEKSTKKG